MLSLPHSAQCFVDVGLVGPRCFDHSLRCVLQVFDDVLGVFGWNAMKGNDMPHGSHGISDVQADVICHEVRPLVGWTPKVGAAPKSIRKCYKILDVPL